MPDESPSPPSPSAPDPNTPLTNAERAELERLRALVDSFDDIVYTLDADQRHTGVYGRWVTHAGLTPAFFLGKTSADVFGAEATVVHTAANQRALAGEDVIYEWTAPAADGITYFETRVSPLRAPDGTVIGVTGVGRDITAERRREQEHVQALERYRAVVDAAPLAVMVVDVGGRVLQWNPGAERIFGWTAAEVIGQRPPYLDAASEADFDANLAFGLAGNMYRGKELRRRCKDGRIVHLNSASAPIHDDTGQVVAVLVILDDITERKQAEAQLRLWELIFHEAGWGITLVDHATNRVVTANPVALAMYGYPPEEFVGKDILQVYAPEARPEFPAYQETLLRAGQVRYETTHIRRDGSRFLANVSVTLHYDAHGQVQYRIANVQDVTEQRRLEQERLRALEQFQTVFEGAPLAIYLLDVEGRVLQWNPGAARILGWTAAEAIGRLPPFLTPATEPGYHANLARVLAGDTVIGTEVHRQRKDGSPVVLNTSGAPLRDREGNVIAAIVVAEDITQRKQTEDQLRLWELTFHDAGWGVIVVDIEQDRIITANPAANTVFGYDDLAQVAPIDLVAPDRRPELTAQLADFDNTQGHVHYESYGVRKDGTRFPIEIVRSVHRDEYGAPRYRIISFQDLSERRRLEAERLHALRRFQAVFDASPLAIHVLNPDGRLELWNPGAERIFGWTAAEVIGGPLPFIDDAARSEFQEHFARVLAGETILAKEVRRRHKDGHWLDLSFTSATFYDDEGRVLGLMSILEDISARKTAEAQLHLWEMIFREAGWGVIVTDATATHILAANPAAAAMYGYRHDEMVGLDVADIFASEDRERLLPELDYVLTQQGYVRYTSIHQRKDGSPFPVELDVSVYRDADGRALNLLANVQDISERRRLEAERLEALERFQAVFDSAPLAIKVLDVAGRVELWNPAAERIFGWTAAEVIGKPLPYIEEDNLAEFRANFAYALTGNTIMGKEIRRRHKDGRLLDLSLMTAPLRDREGHLAGVLAILEDITDRRRLEAERLEALQHFEAVVKSSPLGIISVDGAGIVQLWNPGAERILGWTEDEVLGRQLPYLDATSESEFRRNLAYIMAGQSFTSRPLRRRSKDGRLLDINVATAPIFDGAGRPVAALSIFEDVTARKANEEQLRLWEMIFREAGWAVIMADAATNRMVAANPAALTMYGYSREEFIGLPMRATYAPEVRDEAPARIARVHQAGSEHYTSYHVRKDGTRFPVDVNIAAYRDDTGAVRYRIANVQDITERRRLEAERLDALERFRAVVDSSPLAISVLDPAGRTTLWNPGAERVFGWTAAEVIGKTPLEIGMLDEPKYSQRMTAALAGDVRAGSEVRRRHQDGHILDVSLSTAPLRDPTGSVTGITVIFEDISARKAAAAQLAQATERLHGLYGIDQAIMRARSPQEVATAALTQLRRLVGASRASLMLLDQDAQEGVFLVVDTDDKTSWGAGRRSPIAPDWLQRMLHPPANPILNLTPDMLTSDFLRTLYAEGQRCTLGVSLWAGDQLLGSLNLGSHQTDGFTPAQVEIAEEVAAQLAIALHQARLVEEIQRHSAELEARVAARTHELEAANIRLREHARLKDEFLANMSHELRTPLTGVLNLSEAMAEEVYGPLTPAQTATLGTIVESGRHLAELINDLLDLSRIEAGRLRLHMEPCNLNDVCQSSLRAVQPIAHKRQQSLVFDPLPAPIIITADARRIKQMLLNLLGNAIKFTPEQGRITLRLSAHPDGHEVYLAVCDTGIGIRAEDMPKLFQPFSRLDSSLVRHTPGTGLGLALVKRMAMLHGGDVDVESEPGSGSCFRLVLPVQPPAAPKDATPDAGALVSHT